jgi:1,2-dihydroxy-3-keto-5-methylthiopentene dioxygenase
MAKITIPDRNETVTTEAGVRAYLGARGVFYDRWQPEARLGKSATQDEILAAFQGQLEPFMAKGGYTTADVVSVFADTPNLLAIREKFLKEHTHTEDEIRYFVEGRGLFWFNFDDGTPVFGVLCEEGDLLSVPKGVRHWFDLTPEPHVRAIRIFQDPSGWVAHYTNSGVDGRYNPVYS